MRLLYSMTSNGFTLRSILLLALLAFYSIPTASSLKCKCTQSSGKNPCTDGICEDTRACLMLDHPLSGRHYACSTTRGLKDGECIDKPTKSGSTVKVCACYSSDYCNFKLWPNQHNDFDDDDLEFEHASSRREISDTSFATSATSSIYLITAAVLTAAVSVRFSIIRFC